jgi:polysaccharide biosynthesis transport protein
MWGRIDTSAMRLPRMPRVDPEAVRHGGARAARLGLVGVRGLGQILWRRRLLVLACAVVVLALFAVYAATLPSLYEAETRVAVSGPAGFDPQSAPRAGAPSEADDLVDQLPLIRSRANVERLIDRLDLQLSAEFNPRLAPKGNRGSVGRGALGLIPAALLDAPPASELTDAERATRLRDQIVDAVMPRIHAEPVGRSVLSVRFVAADPNLAAAGATALAELYLEHRGEASQQARRRERQRLGEEVERLAAAIRATESAIAELRATSPAGRERASEGDLLNLTSELAYWRNERALLEARLDQRAGPSVPEASPDHAAQSVDPALLGELGAREIELEQEGTEPSQAYGGQEPQLSSLQVGLVAPDDEKRFEIEHGLGPLQREVAIIRSRETALEAQIETLQNRLAERQAPGDLATLERQAEADRQLLLTHLARVEELDAAPQVRQLDARIVVPAVVPKEPKRPPLALIYGTAIGGALLLGGLLALGAEAWERARA